jgi:Chlorophyll A-B binding protein
MNAVILDDLPGVSLPAKKFDPLGLANIGTDETFAWFQAAELKHSRAAMLAVTGFIIQSAGITFPGQLSISDDISFDSIKNLHPFDQWSAVPDAGKWQIIGIIFIAEIATEIKKPHYMMGGSLPTIIFPSIDFSKVDSTTLKKKRTAELNNGRLAMIAIMAYISDYYTPGSVPGILP